MIERRRCVNQGCRISHRLIPDILIPYKHYEADLIEDVIDGVITEDDLETEDYPCEATMGRWRLWAVELLKNAEGQIRAAAYRILDLSEGFLRSTESLLERIQERIPQGWLSVALRIMINTGGSSLNADPP